MDSFAGNEQVFSQRHDTEDVPRLVRLLQRIDGNDFRLVVIEERDERGFRSALGWIEDQAKLLELPFRSVDLREHPGLAVLDALAEALPDPPQGLLALRGLRLPLATQDDFPALQQLNVQRDLLVECFPCTWLLLVSPYVGQRLHQEAPDFCDFASLWLDVEPVSISSFLPIDQPAMARRVSFGEPLVPFSHPDLGGVYAAIRAWELDVARDLLATFRVAHPEVAREHPLELVYLEAMILQNEGAPAEAQELLRQAQDGEAGQEEEPFACLVGLLLAELSVDLGDMDEAWAEVARVAGQLPETRHPLLAAEVTLLRGQLCWLMGDWDQALAELKMARGTFAAHGRERDQAVAMGQIADIMQSRGEVDEALRIRREEELPVYERLGDARSKAVTMGQIADIMQSRGDVDEALRIFREEVLPVSERLGDARSKAVTMGQIADIMQSRGDVDEAMRIRREEELPVYERLGDAREKAVTMAKIANIMQSRGESDEALRIYREELLPVFGRSGDARAKAVTMGQIADILQSRGDVDEALRIRREEQLPVFERLGDAHGEAACRWHIGQQVLDRKEYQEAYENWNRAFQLLLKLGTADGIAAVGRDLGRFLRGAGQDDSARHVFSLALPAAEKLGMEQHVTFFRKQLAELGPAEDEAE